MLANFFSLLGGDHGISQTVSAIQQAVYYALREPQQRIRFRAESLLRVVPDRVDSDELHQISSWVLSHFRYVPDPRGIEFVKSPEIIDDEIRKTGSFLGDCDDVTGYLGALLKSVGYKLRLVVMTPEKSSANEYQHIFLQAFSRQNQLKRLDPWITLDGTARNKPFGWTASAKRARVYDL